MERIQKIRVYRLLKTDDIKAETLMLISGLILACNTYDKVQCWLDEHYNKKSTT